MEIVHSILQRRSRLASSVAQACSFATEYLRSMEGSIFEVCAEEKRGDKERVPLRTLHSLTHTLPSPLLPPPPLSLHTPSAARAYISPTALVQAETLSKVSDHNHTICSPQHMIPRDRLSVCCCPLRHYAAKLDGCGLELETQVRKSYRLLLSRLLEAIKTITTPPSQCVHTPSTFHTLTLSHNLHTHTLTLSQSLAYTMLK